MKAFTVAGLLAVFLLSGCLYETALEPKPSEAADARFAGTWLRVDDKSNRMTICLFDEKQYALATAEGEDVDIYRAFTSEVDGLRLANVQDLALRRKGGRKWAFFEYRLNSKGQLVIRMVNDKVIPQDLKTPEKLREAIKKNRKNPDLFLKESVYVRGKE